MEDGSNVKIKHKPSVSLETLDVFSSQDQSQLGPCASLTRGP